MSNLGLQMSPGSQAPKGPRHRGRSFLAVLLSLGVLALIGLGIKMVIDIVPSLGGPEDYVGAGTEPVAVVVEQGQSLAQIGQTLKSDGVVASVDAWLAAAKQEPKAMSIGPGTYDMRLQMSGEAAVARMVDPASRVVDTLLLREGLRIWESLATTSKATGMPVKKLKKAAGGGNIGLPAYANDDAEGFLFPATYELMKDESATEILSRLVDRFDQAAADVGLGAGAKALGRTPYEVLTIASLVQAEGHPDDFAKIARVIYNRLDESTWGETYGFLQMDTTVNYALKNKDLVLSNEQVQGTDSPFNTYKHQGLPPTPINSPGQAAMEAALHPVDGDWLWYVTVNTDTGETKFTNDYNEFLKFKDEFSAFLESKK